jgi:hypothetical protein
MMFAGFREGTHTEPAVSASSPGGHVCIGTYVSTQEGKHYE